MINLIKTSNTLKDSSLQIIEKPLLTEKSTNLNQYNQYSFIVNRNSNSTQIKKSIEKHVLERRAQGPQNAGPRDPKIDKKRQKSDSGSRLRKRRQKSAETVGLGPSKQCFRIGGVAKITKSRGLRKVTKMTPKWLPKWSQNH